MNDYHKGKKTKLSLNKIKITKLDNMASIIGGDKTDTNEEPETIRCDSNGSVNDNDCDSQPTVNNFGA